MRAVGEITELCLPHHKLAGLRCRVTILEAKHRFFGEHRVDHFEVGLSFLDMLQRNPGSGIPLLAVLIVQHRVPMRKRAATRILTGKAHAIALVEQGRIGERFRHAPIERQLTVAHCPPIGDDFFDSRMELEVGGNVGDFSGERLQHLHR